jgi:anti-sigma factor RsiW
MKTEEQLKLQAYLDNEVSSSEARQIASWIEKDAEARALYEELRATKALLCAENEAPVAVPEGRDFYWSKIQRGIEAAEREPAREVSARPWWIKLLAPVAGAAALALFVFTSVSTNPNGASRLAAGGPQIEQSETDGSITFYSPAQRMTVVWIPSATETPVIEEADFE